MCINQKHFDIFLGSVCSLLSNLVHIILIAKHNYDALLKLEGILVIYLLFAVNKVQVCYSKIWMKLSLFDGWELYKEHISYSKWVAMNPLWISSVSIGNPRLTPLLSFWDTESAELWRESSVFYILEIHTNLKTQTSILSKTRVSSPKW